MDSSKRRPPPGPHKGAGRPKGTWRGGRIELDDKTAAQLRQLIGVAQSFGLVVSAPAYVALLIRRQYRQDIAPGLALSETERATREHLEETPLQALQVARAAIEAHIAAAAADPSRLLTWEDAKALFRAADDLSNLIEARVLVAAPDYPDDVWEDD